MAKFQNIFLAVVLLVATTQAAGTQRRFQRQKQFARQEAAADVPVVTPYPSADELKPEVPFDEVPAANTPDEVYGPPQVYTPDEVYGPPEVDVNTLVPAESEIIPSEELPVPSEEQSARLALARSARLQNFQRQRKAAYRRAAPLKRRI